MSEFPFGLMTPFTLANIVADLEWSATKAWMKGHERVHLDAAREELTERIGEPHATAMVKRAYERHAAYEGNGSQDWQLVPEAYGCPGCGERDPDLLVWIDDGEVVECGRCGAHYDPDEE